MTTPNQPKPYYFLIPGVLLSWFALIAQLVLIIEHRTASVAETIVRYFSFFTISTNILVALCCTAVLFNLGAFFRKSATQAAIAVYILVVGVVYNLVLRSFSKPEGLDKLVNELLHSVMPSLFVIYWFTAAPKANIRWGHLFPWLLYPLVYLTYTLIRGHFVHYYPYPFLNVDRLGYATATVNCLWVSFAFLVFSLIFIAIARAQDKRNRHI